jgi:hypothetical protein
MDTVCALLAQVHSTYDDMPLNDLMVACDVRSRDVVLRVGGRLVQPYTQSICLKAGFAAWYSYIEGLYARRAAHGGQ